MKPLTFTVIGHPEPAGSKRAFVPEGWNRAVVTDANREAKPWKQEVAQTALALTGGTLFAGPLMVELYFHLARPKGHYGTGRNAGVVKASAPSMPAVKPDVDKLSRAILDALTGTVWRDDAQVVWKVAAKQYGSPERVEVSVQALPATVGAERANEGLAA